MEPDEINTRNHNVAILKSLGYRRAGNTSIFEHGSDFILSPSVAKNTNNKFWFDIREVNLNRINSNTLLLVRIVPDLFILLGINAIASLLSKETMENRPHSGNVWGIHIDMSKSSGKVFLSNKTNPCIKVPVELINKKNILHEFKAHGIYKT